MKYFDLGLRGSPVGFSGFGIRDSPYLMAGIPDLNKYWGQDSRLKVHTTFFGMPKITIGITGLRGNLGKDDWIKEPFWDPRLARADLESIKGSASDHDEIFT